jgi:hypothetical protein
MKDGLRELFTDKEIVKKIKRGLPELFQLAERESSRAGKIGMEIGSVRERIMIALLIYKFGKNNIKTDNPITEPETDVIVYGKPISIKTITGKKLGGVKLIWTVDSKKALFFRETYVPSCDMLLVQINWGDKGWFFYIPKTVQEKAIETLGRKNYIKLPKKGTNPRGVEITKEALRLLTTDKDTMNIEIDWQRKKIEYNVYDKWIEYWSKTVN